MISLEDKSAEITDAVEELVRTLIWSKEYGISETKDIINDSRGRLNQAISGLWK